MTNNDAGFIDMTNLETRSKVVLLTVISGLTIEITTGMKVSRGVQPLAVLKRDYNFTGRTKKAGLKFALAEMIDLDPEYTPSARSLKALD